MAHFWHDLGKAFCFRAVMMVLGERLRVASFGGRFFNRQNLHFLQIIHFCSIIKMKYRRELE